MLAITVKLKRSVDTFLPVSKNHNLLFPKSSSRDIHSSTQSLRENEFFHCFKWLPWQFQGQTPKRRIKTPHLPYNPALPHSRCFLPTHLELSVFAVLYRTISTHQFQWLDLLVPPSSSLPSPANPPNPSNPPFPGVRRFSRRLLRQKRALLVHR